MNILTFLIFAVDKLFAIKKTQTIRESTLLCLAFIGGSLGAFISMNIFRHKTKKLYFTLSIPITLFVQIVLLILFIKR